MPEKRVTIYDVAREAGVSATTVSRTYARPWRVSSETSRHVLEVGRRLGYRAAPTGPYGSREEARRLAILVADSANPVFTQIGIGFEKAALESGYTAMLCDTREDEVIERGCAESLAQVCGGLALAGSRMSDRSILQIAKHCPVVVMNRVVAGVAHVVVDHGPAIEQTLHHLLGLGHTSVTYLSGPEASWANGERWRCLKELAGGAGVRVRRLDAPAPDLRGGALVAQDWLKNPTSAVIGYNDLLAIGFIHAVQRMGIAVPDQVSVVGIDNSILAEVSWPGLTSMGTAPRAAGEYATKLLVHMIEHRSENPTQNMVVPTELRVRSSTGPACPEGTRSVRERPLGDALTS